MSGFPLAVYYHIWADGHWQQPLAEYNTAIKGFTGQRTYSIAGNIANLSAVFDRLPWGQPETCVTHKGIFGNEALTINVLRQYAQDHDGAILYAHTKGAADNTEFRAKWRRGMTARVIKPWARNLDRLAANEADAIGCHWLTEADFPNINTNQTVPAKGSGFFGGNFWMARCDYLRTLPECLPEPRYEAERWIGLGCPRVIDLCPGWPHENRWPEQA